MGMWACMCTFFLKKGHRSAMTAFTVSALVTDSIPIRGNDYIKIILISEV